MTGMRCDAKAFEDDHDGRAHLGTVCRGSKGAATRMEGTGGKDRTGGARCGARGHGVGRDARMVSAGGAGHSPANAINGAGGSPILVV